MSSFDINNAVEDIGKNIIMYHVFSCGPLVFFFSPSFFSVLLFLGNTSIKTGGVRNKGIKNRRQCSG